MPNPPRASHNILQSQPQCTGMTWAWQCSHSKFDFHLWQAARLSRLMALSRNCLAAGAACMRMFIPRAASPPCTPPSPRYPPLPNGEWLSWHWHNALTWPKDVWHLSSVPCPTVLPQLRLCVSKLNFSPDGEIAVQGSGGAEASTKQQHLLQVSVWEQLLHPHKGNEDWGCLMLVLYGNQLFCWSWLCSTCLTPCPARSPSSMHYAVFHLVFIVHNNLLIPWPFLNPNLPEPKSNFLQIISLEKSESIPIKNTDRSHCQLLKTQQSLPQHADSGNKLTF